MAHKHSVYDSDTHFKIDPVTRAISNEGSDKNVLIVGDHNAERFTFELPRYRVDGHDMSLCNCVEVHYINADKMSPEKNKGVYTCTDFEISPDSEDVVICSWLISREATKYVGLLSFALRFACLSDDGSVEYQWSTAIHQGFAISDGIQNTEYVAEEYVDILAQWKKELEELAVSGGGGLTENSVDTDHIKNGAVTPKKLDREYVSADDIFYEDSEGIKSIFMDNIPVTEKDKGKFLRVQDGGFWGAETVPSFEESEF